jgi:hypothetical protein
MAEVVVFDIDAQAAIQKLAQLRADTNALKEAQKQLAEEVKAGNKEAATSYEANAVILKNLANEQRVLSRQVEGYAEVQKKATDTTNFANNSIQQNRDLLKQLTAQYIGLKNPPKEATEQIKKLSETLKTQEAAIGDTRRNVGNYAEALGGLANRIPIVGKATDALNRIQSASPVGRLVEIFFALIDALKGNAEVMDTITFVTAAVNKALGVLADTAVNVGKRIVEVFTNPKKVLEDIAFVLTNPIEAFKRLSNAVVSTGKDMLNAGQEGFEAAKLLDEFTITIAKTNAAIKENDIQVQALTKSLKDRTKSEKERIAIANQIADLEIKNSELATKLAEDELKAEETRLKGRKLAAEDEAKLIELRSAVLQANSEKQIAIAQRTTRINILLQKEEVAANKAAKEELKKTEFDLIKFYEQVRKEELKKTLDNLKINTEQQELLAKEQYANGILNKQQYEAELQRIQFESLEAQKVALEDYGEETTEKQIEYENAVLDAKIQANENLLNQQQQQQELLLQAEQQLQDARIDNAKAAIGLLSELAGQDTVLAKLALAADKSLAIAEIIINTQREISANLAAGAANPLNAIAPGTGQAIAAAQNIKAKIRAGIAIATIAATTIADVALPKKAEGGEISIEGKSHSQGGEIVTVGGRAVAEVEGGEGLYVMKKNAYQKIKQFSAINEAFGGKSWLKGSSKYLADGGAINTTLPILESRGRVNSQIEQNRLLTKAIEKIPAPVLSIKEFEKRQAIKDKSVRISEL